MLCTRVMSACSEGVCSLLTEGQHAWGRGGPVRELRAEEGHLGAGTWQVGGEGVTQIKELGRQVGARVILGAMHPLWALISSSVQ